jgi:hypothetical protein
MPRTTIKQHPPTKPLVVHPAALEAALKTATGKVVFDPRPPHGPGDLFDKLINEYMHIIKCFARGEIPYPGGLHKHVVKGTQ